MESKDDTIDFKKLESELATAIAKDEKYQRENDAKFRAIRQKVATYDEFRDIVLASHIKPLEKNDISGGMPYQAWNKMASKGKLSGKDSELPLDSNGSAQQEFPVPSTSTEFDKVWKHRCKTNADKFRYLLTIGVENMKNIFKTDCPLGEIASCINEEAFFPEHGNTVVEIFEVIALCKRFSITLDFLEVDEKQCIKKVFEKCSSVVEQCAENGSKLEDKICALSKKYKL